MLLISTKNVLGFIYRVSPAFIITLEIPNGIIFMGTRLTHLDKRLDLIYFQFLLLHQILL